MFHFSCFILSTTGPIIIHSSQILDWKQVFSSLRYSRDSCHEFQWNLWQLNFISVQPPQEILLHCWLFYSYCNESLCREMANWSQSKCILLTSIDCYSNSELIWFHLHTSMNTVQASFECFEYDWSLPMNVDKSRK